MMILPIRCAFGRAVVALAWLAVTGIAMPSLRAQRLQIGGVGYTHPPDLPFSPNTPLRVGVNWSCANALGTRLTVSEFEIESIHFGERRGETRQGFGAKVFHQCIEAGRSGALLQVHETDVIPYFAINIRRNKHEYLFRAGLVMSRVQHRFGDSSSIHHEVYRPFLNDYLGGADYNPTSPLFDTRYLSHDTVHHIQAPTFYLTLRYMYERFTLEGEAYLFQGRSTVFLPHDIPRSGPMGQLLRLHVGWGRGDNRSSSDRVSGMASIAGIISSQEPNSPLAGALRLYVSPNMYKGNLLRLLLGAGWDQGYKSLELRRRPGSPLLAGIDPVTQNVLRLELGFAARNRRAAFELVLAGGVSLGEKIPIYRTVQSQRQVGHQLVTYHQQMLIGKRSFYQSFSLSFNVSLLNA